MLTPSDLLLCAVVRRDSPHLRCTERLAGRGEVSHRMQRKRPSHDRGNSPHTQRDAMMIFIRSKSGPSQDRQLTIGLGLMNGAPPSARLVRIAAFGSHDSDASCRAGRRVRAPRCFGGRVRSGGACPAGCQSGGRQRRSGALHGQEVGGIRVAMSKMPGSCVQYKSSNRSPSRSIS